jgi:hypothetical protein
MSTFTPFNARLGRIGLAFAALILIAVVATPALADEESFEQRYQKRYLYDYPNYRNNNHRHNNYRGNNYRHRNRHRHNDNDGFFSFGFGGGPVYSDPPYYYAPPPQYYYPPPAYYPQPRYYQPGPSFNLTIPLGD